MRHWLADGGVDGTSTRREGHQLAGVVRNVTVLRLLKFVQSTVITDIPYGR